VPGGRCTIVHRRTAGRVTCSNDMKPITIAGVVMIVLGLAALAYQGITYTSRETVIDIGPLHATAEQQKTVPLPPILGIVSVAGGVALLIAGARTSRRAG
jgi:hypothetical protein